MAGLSWRLVRGRGRGAIPLSFFICSVLSLAIVMLGKTQSQFMDDTRARLSDMAAPALTGLRVPLVTFERWTAALPTLFVVYEENIKLQRENAELHKWQNVALSLEDRVRRYETLLNAVPGHAAREVTARVIGESSRPFVSTMILNAGAKDGVHKGQAVVDDRGLVGRIYLTGEHTSWVILLTDLNSRVPVMIEPSHRRGILAGNNTAMPVLELDAGEGPIAAGDRVVTTGDGGALPPDLPVGTVADTSGAPDVALLAIADASDFVQILDSGREAESKTAASAAVSSSTALADARTALGHVSKRDTKREPTVQRTSLAQAVPDAAVRENR